MAGTFGSVSVGSPTAIASRLLAARQRAAGLLSQELRDCERDACYGRGMPKRDDVRSEQGVIEQAISLLCQARPERETLEEQVHRRSAERDFAELDAEPPVRMQMRDALGLAR
jgi:hypothetical protein